MATPESTRSCAHLRRSVSSKTVRLHWTVPGCSASWRRVPPTETSFSRRWRRSHRHVGCPGFTAISVPGASRGWGRAGATWPRSSTRKSIWPFITSGTGSCRPTSQAPTAFWSASNIRWPGTICITPGSQTGAVLPSHLRTGLPPASSIGTGPNCGNTWLPKSFCVSWLWLPASGPVLRACRNSISPPPCRAHWRRSPYWSPTGVCPSRMTGSL